MLEFPPEAKTEQMELLIVGLLISIYLSSPRISAPRALARARDALLLAEPARETETDSDPRYQSRCQHGARDIIHDH